MRALLAVLLALAPLAAAAQMPSSALLDQAPVLPDIRRHADWQTLCGGPACTAAPAMQVAPLDLAVTPDGDGLVLVLRAPLGLLLGEGVAVDVDGRAIGRLGFLTCETDGCVAPARLDGALGRALRAGQALTLTLVRRDGTPLTARYSLIGFIAATTDLDSAAPSNTAATP